MELTYSQVSEVPLEVRKGVLCFDWWIANGDRNLTEKGGNPNLFWQPEKSQLVVIDHNQAFDPDFCPDDFFKYHVFKDSTAAVVDDLLERTLYTSKMRSALEGWYAIVAGLPEAWFYIDSEMTLEVALKPGALLTRLQRFETVDFWNWK